MNTKNIIKYNTEYTITYPDNNEVPLITHAMWYKGVLYIIYDKVIIINN